MLTTKEVQNVFSRLMKSAMYDANRAHWCVFGDDDEVNKTPNPTALSYVATMMAKCCAAQALFYSNSEKIDCYEAPDLFHKFYVFSKELQNNFASNRSHQWTDIEYENLCDEFDKSICSQPIAD